MTNQAKHTPGPWRLFMTPDGQKLIGIGDRNGGGVTDGGFGTWRDGAEQLANARLIAAAPELLAALKAIAANPRADAEDRNAALYAISKAEGR